MVQRLNTAHCQLIKLTKPPPETHEIPFNDCCGDNDIRLQ